MSPEQVDDIFLRSHRDLTVLEHWLTERTYSRCQYHPDHPGFRRISLFNRDWPAGRVVCIMPSLFDEALTRVHRFQQAEVVA